MRSIGGVQETGTPTPETEIHMADIDDDRPQYFDGVAELQERDEEEEPLDYEQIDEAIAGIEDPRAEEFLRMLLVEHRQMHKQLAHLQSLQVRHEYAVTAADRGIPDVGNYVAIGSAEEADKVAGRSGGTAWGRSVTEHEWRRLDEPPF